MTISSQVLNSIRDIFLTEKDSKEINTSIVLLDTSKKVLFVAAAAIIGLAIFSNSYWLLIPAYICGESSMFASNVQEICQDTATTLKVTISKSKCRNQLFKNAPLFSLINRIVGPYINTEERVQSLIINQVSQHLKNRL